MRAGNVIARFVRARFARILKLEVDSNARMDRRSMPYALQKNELRRRLYNPTTLVGLFSMQSPNVIEDAYRNADTMLEPWDEGNFVEVPTNSRRKLPDWMVARGF
jgi:hypothetical protein